MNKKLYLNHNVCLKLLNEDKDVVYTYLCLKCLYNPNFEEYYVNPKQLKYIFTSKDDLTTKEKNIFLNSIHRLNEIGLVEILNKETLVLNLENIDGNFNTSYYSVLDIKDIKNCYKQSCFKKSILKYFVYLLGEKSRNIDITSNKEMLFVIMPLDLIEFETELSRTTIIKYNKILLENKLIYIHKSNLKNVANVYGRYEDKDNIIRVCNNYSN